MTDSVEVASPPKAANARAWQVWTVGAALVVAAWAINVVSVQSLHPIAPFVTEATLGEESVGRNLAVTINDVRAATYVTGTVARNSRMMWFSEGTWLVIDLDVRGVNRAGDKLGGATLQIGDRTYRPSERPASLLDASLHADIPQTGSLALELPAEVFTDHDVAPAQLGRALRTTPEADSLIVYDIDLTTLELAAEVALVEPKWVAP